VQKYPVRASHRKGLEAAALGTVLAKHFEGVEVTGNGASASFGAIARISVAPEGRELAVDVTMNPQVPEAIQAETIQRYNRFLEEATGYSSKERAKRLRKSATGAGE
jgi:hypothetical protein